MAESVAEIDCIYDDGTELLIDHLEHVMWTLCQVAVQRYGDRTAIILGNVLTELGDPLNPIDHRRLIDRANELLESDEDNEENVLSFQFVGA